MSLRWTLLEVAVPQGWTAAQRAELLAQPPGAQGGAPPTPVLPAWLPRAAGIVGAALLGFAAILAIASQWGTVTPLQRIVLAMLALVAAMAASLAWRRARVPLAVFSLLGIGGLFALIGQTYPSGADPWQLFALWAVLALPLALATRHEAVWAPWSLVAMTGVSLWLATHTERHGAATGAVLLSWTLALAIVAGLSAAARRWTGAGLWSLRIALTLTAFLVAGAALVALFDHRSVHTPYPLGLLTLAAGLVLTGSRLAFDVFGLSAFALAMNGLLVAGAARAIFHTSHTGDPIGWVLLLGLLAAGLLAASVSLILRLARRREGEA